MQAPIEIPNFEILGELGRGGMATVFLARQLQPKRKVAIKILAPLSGQDETFLESLKQEGDMAAQCSHSNIVTVYACGVIDHHYYLAMEHLGGGDLAQRIKTGVKDRDAISILKQMASALEHAHSIGLLHRDIKPENIMFHENGKAVLVDFGIAKEQDTESNFTKAGAVVGTPHYMSPERATGKPVDARSDLYALGVVFFEMLTQQKLYQGADTFAISYAHVYEPIPKLPAPYGQYQTLLNKLVAKDPDDRFQNATEVLAALERPLPPDHSTMGTIAVAPGELSAVKVPVETAAGKPSRTFGGRRTGAIALLILTVSGAVFTYYWMNREDTPRNLGRGDNLTTAQRLEMQNLLQSATSLTKIGNYAQAEDNLVKVLEKYDCRQQEARRGIQALNPERAAALIAACELSPAPQ